MPADDLTAALRACAAGLHRLEAGTELLISNGTFLHRDGFTTGSSPPSITQRNKVPITGNSPCSVGLQPAEGLAKERSGRPRNHPPRHTERLNYWKIRSPIF